MNSLDFIQRERVTPNKALECCGTVITMDSLDAQKASERKTKRGGKRPSKTPSLDIFVETMNESFKSDEGDKDTPKFDEDTCIGTIDSFKLKDTQTPGVRKSRQVTRTKSGNARRPRQLNPASS